MKEKVRAYIQKNNLIEPKDHILVAVSGGSDSVCLLRLLLELQKELLFTLSVLHVEHGIRGEESLKDAAFVRNICQRWKVPCQVVSVDAIGYAKKEKVGLEEGARILRHKALDEAAQQLGCHKIALAHHGQDQAETILFHMIRGCNLRGLSGIQAKRGKLIRPLLTCSKKEIMTYLEEQGQDYCIDASNASDQYARNKIRLDIMPRLEEINDQATLHINQLGSQAMEALDYMEAEIERVKKECFVQKENDLGYLRISLLQKEHPYIQKQVLYQALAQMAGQEKDLSQKHVESLYRLLSSQSGKRCDLMNHLQGIRQYDKLLIQRKSLESPSPKYSVKVDLSTDGECLLPDGRQLVWKHILGKAKMEEIPRNQYTKWFDYAKMDSASCIRNRQKEDYFYMDTKGHKKLLQDYFVNEKIPLMHRQEAFLLAQGSHVLWLLGYRSSEAYRVSQATRDILEIKIIGGK